MFHEDDGFITELGQRSANKVSNTIKLIIESENPTLRELMDLAWILTSEVQSVIADERLRLRLNGERLMLDLHPHTGPFVCQNTLELDK